MKNKSELVSEIKYHIVHKATYLFSMLPLRVLYIISDIVFFLIYYIVKYRKRVVRRNLFNSFPNKTRKEIQQIEKGFFHWFCDYVFETIKLTSMSRSEMQRRMRFEGLEQLQPYVDAKTPIVVYMGHYCNWEWVTSFAMHEPKCLCANLYHELESATADRFFLKIRTRFGGYGVKMEDTLQTIAAWKKQDVPMIIGFVSDQVPGYSSMHYWPMFLNQLTPTYSGAERIAKLFHASAFYMDIKRPRRGYYVAKMVKMCDNASKEPKFSLTENYYRLLETTIINNPQYWLWSHKRWKRTWEEFCKVYPDEKERKRILSKL